MNKILLKLMLLFLFLFSSGCYCTSELAKLGEDETTVNKYYGTEDEKTLESTVYIREGRNLWSYPAIVVFYVPSVCIDISLSPVYLIVNMIGEEDES